MGTALLLTVILGAASLVGSQAQGTPVHAVSYVNLDLPAGFSLIANPLNHGGNELSTLIPVAPDGATLFKFDGMGFEVDSPSHVEGAGWFLSTRDINEYTLNPGEGAFLWLPVPSKLTFVGEIPQGWLSSPIPTGFSILSSQVPQAGTLSQLGFPAVEGDYCFKWLRAAQMFDPNTPQYFEGFGWFPEEPWIEVGESFFLLRTGPAGVWTRYFTINN